MGGEGLAVLLSSGSGATADRDCVRTRGSCAPAERRNTAAMRARSSGGNVPTEYIPAVGKGCELSMGAGIIARYPMNDVKVTLIDGKYHDTDSSEIAFQMAGTAAFRAACHRCKPVILEPIMSVDVTIPEDGLGWVMGDITRRRGFVGGRDGLGDADELFTLAA